MSLPVIKVHAWGWRLFIFGVVLLGIHCFNLWQPRRQIELHQKNFLSALENRNWRRVKGFFVENYTDRFGHTRDSAVTDLREVLRQFFVVTIKPQGTQVELGPETATITTNITLTGNGPGLTDFITTEVNRLVDPWIFTWRKASLFPWDWRLEKVDNAGLVGVDRRNNP